MTKIVLMGYYDPPATLLAVVRLVNEVVTFDGFQPK